MERINQAPIVVHLVAVLFALLLIVFILSYKVILNSRNIITKPILVVAFIYDFATSFYGTGEALGVDYQNIPMMAILLLLSIMVTSAPLLISQLLDN